MGRAVAVGSSTVTRGYPPYPVISFAHWLSVSIGRTGPESLSNRLIGHFSLRGQTTCGTLVGRIFIGSGNSSGMVPLPYPGARTVARPLLGARGAACFRRPRSSAGY